jgi:hypothetical protein
MESRFENPNTTGQEAPKETQRRPDRLTAMLVLSFIGSGIGAFSYSFYAGLFDEIKLMYEEKTLAIPGLDLLMAGGVGYFLTGAILYWASFIGIYLMWKFKAIGFHFYTASQVLLLVLPITMLKNYPFSYVDLILTIFFIAFYRLHLKLMY